MLLMCWLKVLLLVSVCLSSCSNRGIVYSCYLWFDVWKCDIFMWYMKCICRCWREWCGVSVVVIYVWIVVFQVCVAWTPRWSSYDEKRLLVLSQLSILQIMSLCFLHLLEVRALIIGIVLDAYCSALSIWLFYFSLGSIQYFGMFMHVYCSVLRVDYSARFRRVRGEDCTSHFICEWDCLPLSECGCWVVLCVYIILLSLCCCVLQWLWNLLHKLWVVRI